MLIQRILQLMLVAVVLLAAFALLGLLFNVLGALLRLVFPILIVLLIVAVVLRFFEAMQRRRRGL
jgi:hypothetical protein